MMYISMKLTNGKTKPFIEGRKRFWGGIVWPDHKSEKARESALRFHVTANGISTCVLSRMGPTK